MEGGFMKKKDVKEKKKNVIKKRSKTTKKENKIFSMLKKIKNKIVGILTKEYSIGIIDILILLVVASIVSSTATGYVMNSEFEKNAKVNSVVYENPLDKFISVYNEVVTKYYEEHISYHSKNEYTGIFEGKNVIAIHAESLQNFAIGLTINGQEITPTINKLAKEGMYFSNFYPQISVGTSSDTEFTFNSSLLPSSSGTVFMNYFNREYETILKREYRYKC